MYVYLYTVIQVAKQAEIAESKQIARQLETEKRELNTRILELESSLSAVNAKRQQSERHEVEQMQLIESLRNQVNVLEQASLNVGSLGDQVKALEYDLLVKQEECVFTQNRLITESQSNGLLEEKVVRLTGEVQGLSNGLKCMRTAHEALQDVVRQMEEQLSSAKVYTVLLLLYT